MATPMRMASWSTVEAVDAPLARALAPAAIACAARCEIRPPTSGRLPNRRERVSRRLGRRARLDDGVAQVPESRDLVGGVRRDRDPNVAQSARPTLSTRIARAERNAGIDGMALVLPPHPVANPAV